MRHWKLLSSTVLTSAAMPFKAPNVRWGSSGVSVQLRILKKDPKARRHMYINTRYNQPPRGYGWKSENRGNTPKSSMD